MLPVSGASSPAMMRSSVVLPQPDGPSSETNSPRPTESESSLSTVALPKRFEARSTVTCPAAARSFDPRRRGVHLAAISFSNRSIQTARLSVKYSQSSTTRSGNFRPSASTALELVGLE